jgi:hypothetical protein
MTPIQPDSLRCRPDTVDHYCRNCRAWIDHPEQTKHDNRVMLSVGSRDQACFYLPASELSKLKRDN